MTHSNDVDSADNEQSNPFGPHPSGLPPELVAKGAGRRGRLHAFERMDGHGTALVVIDLTVGVVETDSAVVDIIPTVNPAAQIERAAGGVVAWVTPAPSPVPDELLVDVVGAERARDCAARAEPTDERSKLWPGLDVRGGDIHATKRGWSAFFPGRSDLDDQLRTHGIENVLIAGTVTNVCCASSARDAVELGHRVVMLSDANASQDVGPHVASQATFFGIFGDVRPTADLPHLLSQPPHRRRHRRQPDALQHVARRAARRPRRVQTRIEHQRPPPEQHHHRDRPGPEPPT